MALGISRFYVRSRASTQTANINARSPSSTLCVRTRNTRSGEQGRHERSDFVVTGVHCIPLLASLLQPVVSLNRRTSDDRCWCAKSSGAADDRLLSLIRVNWRESFL